MPSFVSVPIRLISNMPYKIIQEKIGQPKYNFLKSSDSAFFFFSV